MLRINQLQFMRKTSEQPNETILSLLPLVRKIAFSYPVGKRFPNGKKTSQFLEDKTKNTQKAVSSQLRNVTIR